MALERSRVQEYWLTFKNHLLQVQKWFILTNRKSRKAGNRPAWMGKVLLRKLTHKKTRSLEKLEPVTGDTGGLEKNCLNMQVRVNVQAEKSQSPLGNE